MVRVSKNSMLVVAAMLCTAVAGCSSDPATAPVAGGAAPGAGPAYEPNALRLIFTPMYSAFGGAHVYQVPVTIDGAAIDPAGTDPVKIETVQWVVDSKFVSREPFPDIAGAVLLTTKAAGTTDVVAQAETRSGRRIQGTTTLHITAATDAEWDAGQARYDNGIPINFMMLMPMPGATMGGAAGGGAAPVDPMAILAMIPKDASCGNCHNNMMGLTVEHTPLQTAGYSDEELVQIFTMGAKPMGAKFNSPFLKNLPAAFATTIYQSLHKWNISAEVQQGIVLKLRSITPKVQPDIDITRLRMMLMNMMPPGASPGAGGTAAPAVGAAGSAAPAAAGAGGM